MLSKINRLRISSEIENLKESGSKLHTDYFIIVYSPNTLGYPRCAFVVSPKVSSLAVTRNRIRRLASEALRLSDKFNSMSCDFVVIAKKSATTSSVKAISADIEFALAKIG